MLTLILLIIALVCFVAATLGVVSKVNLVALGLALATVVCIIPLV